jgi:hypothetical protein
VTKILEKFLKKELSEARILFEKIIFLFDERTRRAAWQEIITRHAYLVVYRYTRRECSSLKTKILSISIVFLYIC